MLGCGAGTGLAQSLQAASGNIGCSQAVAAFVALARALSGAHLQAVAAGGGGAARTERRWVSSQAAPVEAEEAAVEAQAGSSSSSSSSPAPTASEPAAANVPPPQPASSVAGAVAAAASDAHLWAAVTGFTDAVSSAGMSLAAALMQKQHRGKPPGIAELAVEVLERMRQAGIDEGERLASLLSNPQSLREQQRVRRVMPQLVLIFGAEGAAEVAAKRPAVLGSSPSTVLRALAAMAMCGVREPKALARRSPILLQYCHDSESLVTARLALQHYLGLSAAEVYRTYPSYLLPAPRTLACRLQFLADIGRLPLLVPSRAVALRQWRRQAAAEAAAAGGQAMGPAAEQAAPKRRGRRRKGQEQEAAPAAAAAAAAGAAPATGQLQQRRSPQPSGSRCDAPPPYLTLSHVVKQRVESFCRYAQLDEVAFRAFESGFSSHPRWMELQQRGRVEAARLTRMLDELQAAGVAPPDEPAAAGSSPQ